MRMQSIGAAAHLPAPSSPLPQLHGILLLLQNLRRLSPLISLSRHAHSLLCGFGFEHPLDLGNFLVPIFISSGSISEALRLFNKMSRRNEYAWTSVIEWYVDHGDVLRALQVYGEMREDDVLPSKCTFLALLRACIQTVCMIGGLLIHQEVVIEEFDQDPILGSSLIHLYAKCGSFAEAHCLFHRLHLHDVITWTVLIIGYAEFGDASKALCCFEDMMVEGVSPNAFTIVAALKACSNPESGDAARVMHIVAAKKGFETDPFVGSALMDVYAKFHLLLEAVHVFDKLSVRDVTSWNVLIAGYVENHHALEGLRCYKAMKLSGISPDIITYSVVLKACCSVERGCLGEGQEIHVCIVEDELERDLVLGNALLHMYVKHDLIEDALELMLDLPARDVVSWNTLMAGYAERDLAEETLKCLRSMAVDGVPPDEVTFLWALQACCITGRPGRGLEIQSEIMKKGYEVDCKMLNGSTVLACSHMKVSLATSLIAMYGKCSMMSEARWVFDAWHNRPLAAWNAVMTGYIHQGENGAFLSLLDRMTSASIMPDEITFLSILTMCRFGGHVDYAYVYFETMRKVYSVIPTIKHYGCMVDLLGRSGQLNAATIVVKVMPFQPDLPLYSTMLGACHKWQDAEIATEAFNLAKTLDETHFASFLSILNIYTNALTC